VKPPSDRFRRTAAWTALAAALVALVSGALFVVVARPLLRDSVLTLLRDPGRLVTIGPERADLLRWTYIADLFGYYLLPIPLFLFLSRVAGIRRGESLGRLAAMGGLAYAAIGAGGAVVLALVSPGLIRDATGGQPDPAGAAAVFATITEVVHRGLWQTLELVPAGVWFAVAAVVVRREDMAGAGAALLLAVLSLVTAVATTIGLVPLAFAALSPWLLLFPLLMGWMGARLLGRDDYLRAKPVADRDTAGDGRPLARR
jgi:hypothetical protein